MFDFNLASDVIFTSPLTVRSLLTVASPLNITLKASDFALDAVPFPITKAGAEVENEFALVADEPEELYCPITTEAKSLADVQFPIAVDSFPLAVVPFPIAEA